MSPSSRDICVDRIILPVELCETLCLIDGAREGRARGGGGRV